MSRTLLAWIEYLPRGIRKAWCEVSGGHSDYPLTAMRTVNDVLTVTHVKLHCDRCGRETKWHATQEEFHGL